jgi:hypothetical protein
MYTEQVDICALVSRRLSQAPEEAQAINPFLLMILRTLARRSVRPSFGINNLHTLLNPQDQTTKA